MFRLLALLPLLAACVQDQEFGKISDVEGAEDPEGPEIEVTPTRIDFGALLAGDSVTETFKIKNVGPDDTVLEVSSITLSGDVEGFTILTPEEDLVFSLPGGNATSIDVAFTPIGANAQVGEAMIVSNDVDEKFVTVDLLGEGLVPELMISPDPLDLGTVYVGCSTSENVTLTNVGNDTLVIDSISHSGGMWTLSDPNVLPLTLEPSESTWVNAMFTPLEEGDNIAELVVTSNEPIGRRTALQTGEGRYAAAYEDNFDVPVNPPADIIFFVDQSCSMDDDASALASNFSAFITDLSVYTTDWNVIVTNDDDGCMDTQILTPSVANYDTRFSEYVRRGGGSYTEAGLYVTARAVEATSGCNSGFLRPTAMLHIIMVSDEIDQSPGAWDTYVDRVIAEKGDASLVRFSAIAGDVPGGCRSGSNSADAGLRYADAVSDTGGEFLSICSSWGADVESLATASVTIATFDLTRTPVPETITVSVNGSSRSGGWTYDSATNSILFDEGREPVEGDSVTVNYAGLASCE